MSNSPNKLTLSIALTDGLGNVHGKVAFEVHKDAAYVGERTADDFKLEIELGAAPFDAAVKRLKVREFRKRLLRDAAANLGSRLAEYFEDKEGWHGIERQERLLASDVQFQ